MKQQVGPIAIVSVLVVVIIVLVVIGVRVFNGTQPTVATTPDPNQPQKQMMINGRPVPPGVPADIPLSHGMGSAPAPAGGNNGR